MTVQEVRGSISIIKRSVYMNTGQASPSPPRVLRRIRALLEQQAKIGPGSLAGLALPEELDAAARKSVAELVGSDPEDLQITHSTREGISVVLYGISWRPKDELLICDLEHSSLANPAAVLSKRFGIKVVRVRVDPLLLPGQLFDAVMSALTGRTRLVALSHVQYGCGLRMPVKELARFARRRGVLSFIDGAQSVGQIDVKVPDLECDFYAFSGQKWLMGPVGTGALYVRQNSGNHLSPLFY
ncbi:MAG: aminotransferase class V-fold PLP-dependent enzyme, partial [Blastocatellia bacterium]